MTKRIQVILQDEDYREIEAVARARHMTVEEWVRRALDRARRCESVADVEKKMAAVRSAAQYNFPTADIEDMLKEIERGYTESASSE